VAVYRTEDPDLLFGKDGNGITPLHLAVISGHRDMTRLLMANKAEVNAKVNAKDNYVTTSAL